MECNKLKMKLLKNKTKTKNGSDYIRLFEFEMKLEAQIKYHVILHVHIYSQTKPTCIYFNALMIAYIALFSALLSRCTALACDFT